VIRKEIIFYEQYKQRYENPKAERDKKQEKLNQRKNGLKPSPFHNIPKGHQENNLYRNLPQVQGENKYVNLGFKKTIDNPREPLKCWGCG
jgi:hypothetical protein